MAGKADTPLLEQIGLGGIPNSPETPLDPSLKAAPNRPRAYLGKGSLQLSGKAQKKSTPPVTLLMDYMAMGQNPVPPVNIPIPTKMGGAPVSKWYHWC